MEPWSGSSFFTVIVCQNFTANTERIYAQNESANVTMRRSWPCLWKVTLCWRNSSLFGVIFYFLCCRLFEITLGLRPHEGFPYVTAQLNLEKVRKALFCTRKVFGGRFRKTLFLKNSSLSRQIFWKKEYVPRTIHHAPAAFSSFIFKNFFV